MTDWRAVGDADAIAEDEPLAVEFDLPAHRLELVVIRRGEIFHAVGGRCPHRGAPLGELGFINPIDATLVCGWHYWAFSLETGEQTMVDGMGLGRWPTRIVDGVLQIDVNGREDSPAG
jgi:nitrite reductase/ring-hydroxylating ferredoxin subunit